MNSKIFISADNKYTMSEFSEGNQNISVIPPKYSRQDLNFKERIVLMINFLKSKS